MNESMGMNIGNLGVFIAEAGKGHSPEFWAQRLTDRLMSVADTAPDPIRDQANAFKVEMYSAVLYYVREAMKSAKAEALLELGK